MKKFLRAVIIYLLSIALSLGVFAWGYSITIDKSFYNIINCFSIFLFSLLLISFLLNILLSTVMLKKRSKMNLAQRNEQANKLQKQVEENLNKAEKSVYKSINRLFLYRLFIISAFFILLFLISLTKVNTVIITAVAILTTFVLASILNLIIPISKPLSVSEDRFLDSENYPEIYKIVYSAGQKVNYNGTINIILSSSGTSISLIKKRLFISLKAEEIALLTKDELYAVMIHEFAHYKNADLKRRTLLNKIYNKYENSNNIGINVLAIFTSHYENILIEKAYSYDFFSSCEIERQADIFVKEMGVANDYINATAKITLFALYSEHPWKEVCFDVYENPTPVKDYAVRNYNCFIQKMALYGDKWHFTLKNELSPKANSHPTFKSRMQDLKVDDYLINFDIPEGDYKLEQTKLFEKMSLLAADGFDKKNNDYLQIKRFAYEDRITCMKKYDQYDAEWNVLSDSELIECAQAYLFIDDKKAEKILLEVIERSNSSFACFILACYYSREYDDRCIEFFKRASSDSSATDEALSGLAKYALKTGNQKLLDEYHETVVLKNQTAEEEIYQTLFTTEGLIAPTPNFSEDLNEITQKMSEYWKNGANAIYVAIRETENQTIVYYIAVEIDKKFSPQEGQKAYEESCYFINRMSHTGKKFYIYFAGKEFNYIKNMKNTCVYKKQNLSDK